MKVRVCQSIVIVVCVVLASVVTPSVALDVGAPLYSAELGGGVALEITYLKLDRKIEQEIAFTSDTF